MRIRISIATLLATVAVLQTVAGALWGFFYAGRADFAWNEWLYVFYGPPCLALAFLGRRFPYPCAVVGLMLYCPVMVIHRHPELLADGSLLKILNFVLLLWACLQASFQYLSSFEARVGLPPLPGKARLKIIALSAGIIVSIKAIVLVFLVLAFNTTLDVDPAFKVDPWFDRLVHNVRREALICAIIAAVASAVLSFCLLRLWPLIKERRRQVMELKARMKAEGKKWPCW